MMNLSSDMREAPGMDQFRTSLDLAGKGSIHPDLEDEVREASKLDRSLRMSKNNSRLSHPGASSPKASESGRSDKTKTNSIYGSQQTREDQLGRENYDDQ